MRMFNLEPMKSDCRIGLVVTRHKLGTLQARSQTFLRERAFNRRRRRRGEVGCGGCPLPTGEEVWGGAHTFSLEMAHFGANSVVF